MSVRIRYIAWVGACLLLAVLSGCSTPGASSSAAASITPLALTPSPKTSTPTPTVSAAKDTDWTTYHRDNSRTGSVANMPDPQRLSRTWNTHLDGAVYAQPL